MKKLLLFQLSIFLLFLLLITSICIADSSSQMSQPPIPTDLVVEAPNASLPPEVKAFSGKWRGRWYYTGICNRGLIEGLNSIMVVEKILDLENASVVYARGDSPEWNITKGVSKYQAKIDKNAQGVTELSFSSSRRSFRFTVSPEGRLNGTNKSTGSPIYIEMDRFK
jgi:hypothetical protein